MATSLNLPRQSMALAACRDFQGQNGEEPGSKLTGLDMTTDEGAA